MMLHVQQPPSTPPSLPSPAVLLVERHADTRALYALDLRHFGFRVKEAQNTAEAIQTIAASVPDIVVADLTFRDPGELELCRRLKDSTSTKDVPIIAITANAAAEARLAAEEAGCAAVLVKPCLPADVRAEIERVLATSVQAQRRATAVRHRAQALARRSVALKMKSERLQTDLTQRAMDDIALAETLARVRAEFIEMPGLHLTIGQAARLLALDRTTAGRLLDRLVAEGFLRRTGTEMYLRAG